LGGPRLAPSAALEILRAFITTPWGADRHGRRVEKITRIEQRHARTHN
jgi:ribose 5-phosphate isomerase RpiB